MEVKTLTKKNHHDVYPAIDPTRPALSAAGKTVLVTGAGQGIGAAISRAFALAGASHLILLGRKRETLDHTRASITDLPHNKSSVHVFPADVADGPRMHAVFGEVLHSVGKIDVVVANAGYLPTRLPLKDVDVADFVHAFEVNVKGLLLTMQGFLSAAAETPVFINITSAAGQIKYFGSSGYATSKLAGMRLVDYLSGDYPDVRAYSVQPGMIVTAMGKKAGFGEHKEGMDTPELPAAFCVWLASPEAEFLKGKMLWANWDVEEMSARKEEIAKDGDFLTMNLEGFNQLEHSTTLTMG
ncbi:hypothetical protein MMC13_007989 [Lambiella insularis]|nr:hypothetical protein [Lambiella insularis]